MGFQNGLGSKKKIGAAAASWTIASSAGKEAFDGDEWDDSVFELDEIEEDLDFDPFDPSDDYQKALDRLAERKARGFQSKPAALYLDLPGALAKDWRQAASASWSMADADDIEHCMDQLAAKNDRKSFELLAKNAAANGVAPSAKALSRRAWRCVVSGAFDAALLWSRVVGFDPNAPAQAGALLLHCAVSRPNADRSALAFCKELCEKGAKVEAGEKNALADAVLSSNYDCALAIAAANPASAASVANREELFKCAAAAARFDLAMSLRGSRLEWRARGEQSPLMGLLRSLSDGAAQSKPAAACAKLLSEEMSCSDDSGIAACCEQLNLARGFCEARGWVAIGREVGRAWEIMRERFELLGASLAAGGIAKGPRAGRSL